MRVADVPPPDAPPAAPPDDDAEVARGRRTVRIGLALNALGILALGLVAVVGAGPGARIGGTGWLGALVTQAALVAAVLSGSRLARGFMVFTGVGSVIGACSLLVAERTLRDGPRLDLLLVVFAACLLVSGTGALLATLGPGTGAWYRAVRATRARARSLAEWRRGG